MSNFKKFIHVLKSKIFHDKLGPGVYQNNTPCRLCQCTYMTVSCMQSYKKWISGYLRFFLIRSTYNFYHIRYFVRLYLKVYFDDRTYINDG